MKRILIALILLACCVPFASAANESADWYYPGLVNYGNVDIDAQCAAVNYTYSQYPDSGWKYYQIYYNGAVGGAENKTQPVTFYLQNKYPLASGSNDGTNVLALYIRCSPTGGWYFAPGYNTTWARGTRFPLVVNFTASATEVIGPDYVFFTDTTTGATETSIYNWSYSPTTGVMVAPQDLDNQDATMLFTVDGNYTITHGVSNWVESGIETKTDYIWVHNTSEIATMRFRAVDAVSGYGINGAQVDVYDVENTSWTNTTTTTGEATVTMLSGHTANAYGSALGYDAGESLALPAINNELYPIYMWPSTMTTNTTAGNLTLYVTVLEDGTNERMAGYGVSYSIGGAAGGADYTAGITNSNGIFQTTVANQTTIYVRVPAQKGHLSAAKSIYTGDDVGGGDAYIEETIWLQLATVTTAPTLTTGPGGTVPVTEDPYPCDADHPENCQRKQTEMASDLIAYGPAIIQLCILATIVGLIKIMGKK